MKTLSKKCKYCGKQFNKRKTCSMKEWATRSKYCTALCFRLDHGGWMKGTKVSMETKEKMSRSRLKFLEKNPDIIRRGERHPAWKGANVSYSALHCWLTRYLGNPAQCEKCGKSGKYNLRNTENGKLRIWDIQWANKSGEYKRSKSDWLKLCISCHKKYDLNKIKYYS